MSDILPTHACFDDAMDYIEHRVRADPRLARGRTLVLVHAIVLSDADARYAHAWVEEDDQCWDCGLIDGQRVWYAVHRDEYYAIKRVQQTARYTPREILKQNRKHGTYGPWEEPYRSACGGGGRVMQRVQADASSAIISRWGDT